MLSLNEFEIFKFRFSAQETPNYKILVDLALAIRIMCGEKKKTGRTRGGGGRELTVDNCWLMPFRKGEVKTLCLHVLFPDCRKWKNVV
jgi:hypothetical protein